MYHSIDIVHVLLFDRTSSAIFAHGFLFGFQDLLEMSFEFVLLSRTLRRFLTFKYLFILLDALALNLSNLRKLLKSSVVLLSEQEKLLEL